MRIRLPKYMPKSMQEYMLDRRPEYMSNKMKEGRPHRMPDVMSEYMPDSVSAGGDHSKAIIRLQLFQ